MGAKVRADCRSQHPEPLSAVEPAPVDPELEADVGVFAAWFEALPAELQRWFDHEAVHGRSAYAALAGGSPGAPVT
jgi:hypothetical protein